MYFEIKELTSDPDLFMGAIGIVWDGYDERKKLPFDKIQLFPFDKIRAEVLDELYAVKKLPNKEKVKLRLKGMLP